jgi:hypothetical protein
VFYAAKNCKVSINGQSIYASAASLESTASISASFLAGRTTPERYAANNGVAGSLRLSYFLTGKDVLKDYLQSESGYLTGNFGGLMFNSGRISSYSLQGVVGQGTQVDADITFFEDITGTFVPSSEKLRELPILNFGDAFVSTSGMNIDTNIIRFAYSATIEVQPSFTISREIGRRIIPQRIVIGRKQATAEISSDNLDLNLPPSGIGASVTLNLCDASGVVQENFTVKGIINRKTVDIGVGKMITSTYSIHQDSILAEPTISGFIPASGFPLTLVRLVGSNLVTASDLYLNNARILFRTTSDNNIFFFVPKRAGGTIKVVTQGGVAESNGFVTLDPGIPFF